MTKYPDYFDSQIESALKTYSLSLADSKSLAKRVLELSDFFIQNPDKATPWNKEWAQIAYLCYYLPLNSVRLTKIIQEANRREFFKDITHVVDFGAGLATASLNLSAIKNFQFHLIERSKEPQKIIADFFPEFKGSWHQNFTDKVLDRPEKTMAVFSYSLTELKNIPEWALQCEALMLVEPSTQQDGRKLLELREKLIAKGYHPYAPCTHEDKCPLLHQSKNDWCHDRVLFNAPSWFLKMEEQLPMKNRSLTMSYLLMRRTPPTAVNATRVVGDRMKEKGKDRQMICRGTEREFLAWLHKTKISQEIPRGTLIQIPESSKKVSNEVRIEEEIPLYE